MIREMEPIKVVAKVKFNDGFAYVLNRNLDFRYTKIDQKTIIGEDEGTLLFYTYEPPSWRWKAFTGRQFELTLTDGTVEKCHGQWWDGINDTIKELFDLDQIYYFSYSTIEMLKEHYLFMGCMAEKSWIEQLDSTYKDEIYGYWDYKKMIKEL